MILQPVCECLGLKPLAIVGLLNSFFCEHPEAYDILYRLEESISKCEAEINWILQNGGSQFLSHQALENDPRYVNAQSKLR